MSLPVRWIAAFAAVANAFCQIPLHDRRNGEPASPDTHFHMAEYSSVEAWQARRSLVRSEILSAAGLLPLPDRNPLRPTTARRLVVGDVVIETIVLETLPGYFLTGNLYRPLRDSGRRPAVLSPHGHWKRGRLENIPSYSVPALGFNLARQGYIVFAHDMVGYQDTRQTSHDFGGWREQLWSFSPLGLQLWNSIRALDYLESRPDVDPQRLAVTGASGGGTQTILLAAVDDRIRVDAPVNMVSAYAQGADPCEEAPNLRLDTFNVEIASMMAPRPMLLVSCSGDWTRNTPGEEFPAIRHIYALYGAAAAVSNVHFNAHHNYNVDSRQAVYRFFSRDLLGLKQWPGPETAVPALNDADLKPAELPGAALEYDSLFRQWRDSADRQNERAADPDEIRTRLRLVFGADWPSRVVSGSDGDRQVLSRPGKGDRVPVRWFPGNGEPVVVIHSDGMDAALRSPIVAEMIAGHQPVVLADVFQSGSAKTRRDRSGSWFLSYNQTDDANRVQDILTVMAWVKSVAGQERLVGLDEAAIWCAFAAALAPIPVHLSGVPSRPFNGTDDDFHDRFFVPGIQRAGGWQAVWKLLGAEGATRPTEGAAEAARRRSMAAVSVSRKSDR